MKKLTLTFLLVLMLAATVFGCGGGSGQSGGNAEVTSSSSGGNVGSTASTDTGGDQEVPEKPADSSAPLTKAEFIERGDAICEAADQAQADAYRIFQKDHPKEPQTKAEKSELAEAVGLPPLLIEAQELAELTPPKGEEKEIKAIVAALNSGNEYAEKFPESPELPAGNPYEKVDKLAKKYGFKACDEAV